MPETPIRLVDLGRCPAGMTQAVYHVLTERMQVDSPDTIVLCRPDAPYLCLGRFQEFDSVFDATAVRRHGLAVYRRKIGGGATYLDDRQLFYQFIFHHSRVPVQLEKTYARLLAAPLKTLQSFGLNARLRALNEVEVNGRRIAGIGGGRLNDGCVVVGNFLFDFDYRTMAGVWAAPWDGFRKLAEKALAERVYTLKQAAPHLTMEMVRKRLCSLLPDYFKRPLVSAELSREEWNAAENYLQKIACKRPHTTAGHEAFGAGRPLKIAAGVFIHHRTLMRDGKEIPLSFRTDDDRVTAVRAGNTTLQEELQSMLGRPLDLFLKKMTMKHDSQIKINTG